MYTLHTEKLRLIVPFMGNLKHRKANGCDAFTLQRVQLITQKQTKKIYKNSPSFYCLLVFLQWDAPLLCNTCALLKDEEKVAEKDLYDFAFSLLENGSGVAKIQVAHTLGLSEGTLQGQLLPPLAFR